MRNRLPVSVISLLGGLAICGSSAACALAGDSVTWQENLSRAFQMAQQAQRPLVVLLSKENCPHCVKLKAHTLTESKVIEKLNGAYVTIRLDGPRYPGLVQKTGVRGYPTILVISPENQLMGKIDGFVDAETLARRLDTISAAQEAKSRGSLPR